LRKDRVPSCMGAALSELNTEAGPPLAVPLQHFFVGLVFLLADVFAGALAATVYAVFAVNLLSVVRRYKSGGVGGLVGSDGWIPRGHSEKEGEYTADGGEVQQERRGRIEEHQARHDGEMMR